jgi:imidazole glycerol-phosphate synthase subunit HisF
MGWPVLKRRIIPIQLLLDGRLVKTTGFGDYRDVGDPVSSSRVYNSQYADELVLLNIARESRTVEPLATLMEAISEVCFMPLTVGGGIRDIADVEFLIRNGADKVLINSAAYGDRSLIAEAADHFGSQAVIVGIDAAWNEQLERYEVFADCGRSTQIVGLEDHVAACVAAGAGEIMIQSIDRDGAMGGYDVTLTRKVAAACDVPIIAAGGSGNYEHLKEVFLGADVSAAACGSLFNFSDSNPIRAKAFLSNYGLSFKVV